MKYLPGIILLNKQLYNSPTILKYKWRCIVSLVFINTKLGKIVIVKEGKLSM